MALTPTLSYKERNDNRLLTLNDATLNWGVGGNINVTDVTVATLDITITTSDSTATTYTQINLIAEFGDGVAPEFNTQADMVFEIDATLLLSGGVAYGTADDVLPDGIWSITYTINTNVGILEEDILIDGIVRTDVYELLRALPVMYNCNECKSKTVSDALYAYGCLNVLQSNAYVAKTEELISLLYTLERIIANGSNYTW